MFTESLLAKPPNRQNYFPAAEDDRPAERQAYMCKTLKRYNHHCQNKTFYFEKNEFLIYLEKINNYIQILLNMCSEATVLLTKR